MVNLPKLKSQQCVHSNRQIENAHNKIVDIAAYKTNLRLVSRIVFLNQVSMREIRPPRYD